MLGAFLVGFGPRGWSLGSQMVELGCQDTDWVGRNDKQVLDGILARDGLKLLTYSQSLRRWFSSSRTLHCLHMSGIVALKFAPHYSMPR